MDVVDDDDDGGGCGGDGGDGDDDDDDNGEGLDNKVGEISLYRVMEMQNFAIIIVRALVGSLFI